MDMPPEFAGRPGGSYRLVLTYKDAGRGHGKATAESDVVEACFVSLEPSVGVVQESISSPTIPRSLAR